MECQLFCKCSNCDSDPLLVAKVNEYRGCYQYGSACISSQCLDAEFLCNNCFVVLQEDDIDCDDGEDFGQIFEDGVAAASNSSVSKFTEAVTSIEASFVQEEVQSKIIADLQQCIVGPVSKKLKADTRVSHSLARGFSDTKKNSKKTPKVSQKATKNTTRISSVAVSSNPNSEQQVSPFLITHVSNDRAVISSNSTATTIPQNVLERYLQCA
jgi:hypothetical protein